MAEIAALYVETDGSYFEAKIASITASLEEMGVTIDGE